MKKETIIQESDNVIVKKIEEPAKLLFFIPFKKIWYTIESKNRDIYNNIHVVYHFRKLKETVDDINYKITKMEEYEKAPNYIIEKNGNGEFRIKAKRRSNYFTDYVPIFEKKKMLSLEDAKKLIRNRENEYKWKVVYKGDG